MFQFDLLDNEKVVRIYRQSEAVLFKPVLFIFIAIYFPWYFLLKYNLAAEVSKWLLIWTLLVLLYGLNKYLLWLLNVTIITDKRLVVVYQHSLFNKKVLESPLQRILNVGFEVKGFWRSLFNFGNVEIQSSGMAEPLVIKNVGAASEVKDFLWQFHSKNPSPAIVTRNLDRTHA